MGNIGKLRMGLIPPLTQTHADAKIFTAFKFYIIWKEIIEMKKYFCNPCGYTYDPAKGDPEHGIKPGTAFEDLPDDWVCPVCGIDKSMFQPCIDNYN